MSKPDFKKQTLNILYELAPLDSAEAFGAALAASLPKALESAYRSGQEEMRERAAKEGRDAWIHDGESWRDQCDAIANKISALPLSGEEKKDGP